MVLQILWCSFHCLSSHVRANSINSLIINYKQLNYISHLYTWSYFANCFLYRYLCNRCICKSARITSQDLNLSLKSIHILIYFKHLSLSYAVVYPKSAIGNRQWKNLSILAQSISPLNYCDFERYVLKQMYYWENEWFSTPWRSKAPNFLIHSKFF